MYSKMILSDVYVFYCAVRNYHKLSTLRKTSICYPTVLWVRSAGTEWLSCVFFSGLIRLETRCWLYSNLIWRFWLLGKIQTHTGCWSNLFPCTCRTELPCPCWLSSQFWSPKDSLCFFSHCPCGSLQNSRTILSHSQNPLTKSVTPVF